MQCLLTLASMLPADLEDHLAYSDRVNVLSSMRSPRTCVQLRTNGEFCHFRSGELFHLIRNYRRSRS